MAATQKRIRILFTIPNFDTAGSGKALMNVALGLDPDLFEAHIVCSHDRGDYFKEVKRSGLPVHVFAYTCAMRPYHKGLWRCFKISQKLKSLQPDIIHSFHYASDYSEALASKMAGIPWVYTKKNMNWGGASKNSWRLRTLLASAVVAQNTDMISDFFPKLKKLYFIPRGVNTEAFIRMPSNSVLKSSLKLKDSDRILCCVANLSPIKGVEVLLRAFKKAHPFFPEWKLLLVGDDTTAYGQSLVNLCDVLGLKDFVVFCGKQANVNDYLNLSEVAVLPTLEKGEGSPVSLLEAMACAVNVFGSDVPGIKDQLQPFPEHLVKPGDVDAWCSTLKRIFEDSTANHLKLGQQFRSHVLKNYSIEHEVRLCTSMYLNLIKTD